MPTKSSRELYLLERFLPLLFAEDTYTVSQPVPPLPDAVVQLNQETLNGLTFNGAPL